MEMELDLAIAGANELAELVEEVRSILLAGEEPAVPRWAPVAVAKLRERGIAVGPGVDARATDVVGSFAMEGLVVITEREQQVNRLPV